MDSSRASFRSGGRYNSLATVLRNALVFAALACVSHAGLAFTLQDSEGKTWKLADLKGKWVVVNFWATWCAPCIKEIPDFAAFAKAHPGNVVVLGVALDYDDKAVVKAFAKKVGLTYPLVYGEGQAEAQFGKVKGLPTTFVYDPSGKEVLQKTGTVDRETLEALLRKSSLVGT